MKMKKRPLQEKNVYRHIDSDDSHGVLQKTEGGKTFEELAPDCVKAICDNLDFVHKTGTVLGETAAEMLLSGLKEGAFAVKKANLEKIPADLVPLKMACERTGLTRRHLYKLARRGTLTIIKVGKYGFLPRSEYDALIFGKVR